MPESAYGSGKSGEIAIVPGKPEESEMWRRITTTGEADRNTLIRRVTYAVTGLPPTPEELETFLADQKPGA